MNESVFSGTGGVYKQVPADTLQQIMRKAVPRLTRGVQCHDNPRLLRERELRTCSLRRRRKLP